MQFSSKDNCLLQKNFTETFQSKLAQKENTSRIALNNDESDPQGLYP